MAKRADKFMELLGLEKARGGLKLMALEKATKALSGQHETLVRGMSR